MKILGNYKRFILACCVGIGSLALFATLFSSCGRVSGGDRRTERDNRYNVDDGDRDRDRDRDSDRDRDRGNTSSSSNCGRSGGGSCEGDDDCEEWCEDLFSSGRDEDECLELSVNEVEVLYETFDENDGLLANPEYDARRSGEELNEVCVDAIELALTIDENYWKDLYDEYSESEARDVLLWFSQDESIYSAMSRGIREADDDNDSDDIESAVKEFFKTLLEKIGDNSVIEGLQEELDTEEDDIESNTFFVYATDNLPNSVLRLVHELAGESCGSNRSSRPNFYNENHPSSVHSSNREYRTQACLVGELYCIQDGSTFLFEDETVFDSFLDESEDLEDYLEDLFEDRVNDDVNDILDDGAEEICPNYCTVSGLSTNPTACPVRD